MSSRKMNPRLGEVTEMTSGRPSVKIVGGTHEPSGTPLPPSPPPHATSLRAGGCAPRSSGKRTLTAEEADEYERCARRKGPVESKAPIGSKLTSDAVKSEFIIISDDEREESLIPPSSQPPKSPSNIPASKSAGNEEGPSADSDEGSGSIPLIQPIAIIILGQESASPDSESAQGLIQQLENAMKQAMSIVGAGWGTFADFDSFIANSLREIQRIGGACLAGRCEQKLIRLKAALHCLERLVFSDLFNEVEPIVAQVRARRMRERKAREESISEKEAFLTHLLSRQHQLQAEMEVSSSAIARMKAQLADEELTLKGFQLESANVHNAVKTAMKSLHESHREEETADTSFEAKIWMETEAQVRANRAEVLADIKAELASFTLLD